MKKYLGTLNKSLSLAAFAVLLVSCQDSQTAQTSDPKVTTVKHTPVKRQSIGNCWLYAHSTWLESMLLNYDGKIVNVSESYWTYWRFFEKLRRGNVQLGEEEEFATGGSWGISRQLILDHGWVEEENFIPDSNINDWSAPQACAVDYLETALRDPEHVLNKRPSDDVIKQHLNEAFSCKNPSEELLRTVRINFGRTTLPVYNVENIDEVKKTKAHKAADTKIKILNTGTVTDLASMVKSWKDEDLTTFPNIYSEFEGKKLQTQAAASNFRTMEQRIKKALNDNQPVVISFFVSFNAADANGIFNLDRLAETGSLGSTGGHMVVAKDYTVRKVAGVEFERLGEGDMDAELKAKALDGEMDYLVVKNSWGMNRSDRPWLADGSSRLSWDYLTNGYYDENNAKKPQGSMSTFLWSVALPPGY
jgi:hypothetical protein